MTSAPLPTSAPGDEYRIASLVVLVVQVLALLAVPVVLATFFGELSLDDSPTPPDEPDRSGGGMLIVVLLIAAAAAATVDAVLLRRTPLPRLGLPMVVVRVTAGVAVVAESVVLVRILGTAGAQGLFVFGPILVWVSGAVLWLVLPATAVLGWSAVVRLRRAGRVDELSATFYAVMLVVPLADVVVTAVLCRQLASISAVDRSVEARTADPRPAERMVEDPRSPGASAEVRRSVVRFVQIGYVVLGPFALVAALSLLPGVANYFDVGVGIFVGWNALGLLVGVLALVDGVLLARRRRTVQLCRATFLVKWGAVPGFVLNFAFLTTVGVGFSIRGGFLIAALGVPLTYAALLTTSAYGWPTIVALRRDGRIGVAETVLHSLLLLVFVLDVAAATMLLLAGRRPARTRSRLPAAAGT